MVPKHARAVAGSARVTWPCARPTANCSALLKKPLKFAAATLPGAWICHLSSLGTSTTSSEAFFSSNCVVGSVFGVDSHRIDHFVFPDFLVTTSTKDPSHGFSRRQQPSASAIGPHSVKAVPNVPAERFADLGGMEEAKEQIREVVQGHSILENTNVTGW